MRFVSNSYATGNPVLFKMTLGNIVSKFVWGSQWTLVNHPSMETRHPADVVCEVDSESMIKLILEIERSQYEQSRNIRSIGASIKLCVREHFYKRRKAWTS